MVIWTLPSGQKYVTTPGSALLFPTLSAPTGDLPPPDPKRADRHGDPMTKMPRRKTTRAQNRARYVADERRANRRARQATRPPDAGYFGPAPPDTDEDDDPPPF